MYRIHPLLSVCCCIAVIFGTACNKSDIVAPQVTEPGKLKVTLIRGLGKTSGPTLFSDVSYDLGDIRSSTNYHFLVSNIGGTTIKNIELTMNDSNFSVYPTRLDSVESGTTVDLRNLEELPIVKVSAIHGAALSGTGFARLMRQGPNTSLLRISGTTNSGSNVVRESLSVWLRVNALVMSVALYDSTREIDLSQPNGSVLVGGFLNSQFVSLYYVYDTVRITNNGNVPIIMGLYTPTYTIDTLGIGQTLILGDRPSFHVSFFAWNTAADPVRFRFYPDGRSYIRLWRN